MLMGNEDEGLVSPLGCDGATKIPFLHGHGDKDDVDMIMTVIMLILMRRVMLLMGMMMIVILMMVMMMMMMVVVGMVMALAMIVKVTAVVVEAMRRAVMRLCMFLALVLVLLLMVIQMILLQYWTCYMDTAADVDSVFVASVAANDDVAGDGHVQTMLLMVIDIFSIMTIHVVILEMTRSR